MQEARTEAVRRGDKSSLHIYFDGFYLTRGHYSNNVSATVHDAKTGKIIAYSHRTKRGQGANWEGTSGGAAWPTMLRHQAAENSLTTSGAAKKELFSSRDNCNCWALKQFERTSYFLGIQAWLLRQNEKQNKKKSAKEWSKKHNFHSHFFNFHYKPKRMLKFPQNGF